MITELQVLLKGVNDKVETLQRLCEILIDHGVIPYYLHHLDRVVGAEHFEVDVRDGQRLIKEIQTKLSGYAVPKYVQEIPGDASKREFGFYTELTLSKTSLHPFHRLDT